MSLVDPDLQSTSSRKAVDGRSNANNQKCSKFGTVAEVDLMELVVKDSVPKPEV